MTVAESKSNSGEEIFDRPTWEIRPGVHFPDWSVIASPKSATALADILSLLQVGRLWDGYDAAHDKVRRTLLLHYGRYGRAPSIQTLSGAVGVSEDQIGNVLVHLRDRDLVVYDGDKNRIYGAYPFTDRDTDHRVVMEGLTINAMCAIDALGAGAMYRRDIHVTSRCRGCGAPIRIQSRALGTAVDSCTSDTAVVWSGLRYADNCAATSLCTVIAFFCSDRHLEKWRDATHPDIRGHRLSVKEAHEVGMAIFGPMLATAKRHSAGGHIE